jgi:manganese/iron transport system ATP-binding protein
MAALPNQSDPAPARLDFREVTVSIGNRQVLENISFQVPHGARLAVVGPNGAGKSSLFKALVGLLPLDSGQIFIHGQPRGTHGDCVAYVPQREEVDLRFPVTVRDVVGMGRFGRLGWLRPPGAEDRRVVEECLRQMDISNLADRSIQDLSGGQQQRAFLARALAQQPHILLMDEPFNGVDISTQQTTLQLLDELQTRHVTVMVSTHDLNLARESFDLVLMLNRGLIAFGTPAEVFTTENIRKAFQAQVMVLSDTLVVDQCCGGDHEHVHEADPTGGEL